MAAVASPSMGANPASRRGSVSYMFQKIRSGAGGGSSSNRRESVSYIKPSSSSPDVTTSYDAAGATGDRDHHHHQRLNGAAAAAALQPLGSGIGIGSPTSSPMTKSRSRKSIWSRKQHRDMPPVPDLPHSLGVDLLPFERDAAATPSETTTTAINGNGSSASVNKSGSGATPSTTTTTPAPTEAAGIAQQVTQQYAERDRKLKDSGIARAQVLSEARLTPSQVADVVKLAGSEIKQRGLANVGIFRPFRVGASPEVVDRMAELYLLSVDAERYEGALSVTAPAAGASSSGGSDLAVATFGKPSASKELAKQLAYAKISDVADFLKWSFRRLKLSRLDFASANPLTWYNTFVKAEKDGSYPRNAFSTLLLPRLPFEMQRLLNETLDLLTTVSAHYVANAMPAWRVCKTFGYWLFGRIESDKPATDLPIFLDDWARSSAILEHLLLAYLRDQSTKVHYMPTRLAQLIEDYPIVSAQSEMGAPGLQVRGAGIGGAEVMARALKVTLSSENVQPRSLRHPRGPSDTLAAVLTARSHNGESSAEADDWAALVALAQKATRELQASVEQSATPDYPSAAASSPEGATTETPATATEAELEVARETALLRDEDVRIFSLIAAELVQKKAMMGVGAASEEEKPRAPQAPALPKPTYGSIANLYSSGSTAGRQADGAALGSLPRSGSWGSSSRAGPLNAMGSALDPLPENSAPSTPVAASGRPSKDVESSSAVPKLDWDAFRDGGFAGTGVAKANGSDTATTGFDHLALDTPVGIPRLSDTFSITSRPGATSPTGTNNNGPSAGLLRRATSFGTLRRKKDGRDALLSLNGGAGGDGYGSSSAQQRQQQRRAAKPRHSVIAITTMDLDEILVSVWQDALLDFCPAVALPGFVAAQLNKKAAASLISGGGASANPSTTTSSTAAGMCWLVVEENIVPRVPAATLPRTGSGGKAARGALRRARSSSRVPRINAGGVHLDDVEDYDDEMEDRDDDGYPTNDTASSIDGRRSLFAPSFKSLKAMSINLRKRASMRKLNSGGGGGGGGGAGSKKKREGSDGLSGSAGAGEGEQQQQLGKTSSPGEVVPPLPTSSPATAKMTASPSAATVTPTKKARKKPLISLALGGGGKATTTTPAPTAPVSNGTNSLDRAASSSIISSPASSTPAMDSSVMHAVSPAAFAAATASAAASTTKRGSMMSASAAATPTAGPPAALADEDDTAREQVATAGSANGVNGNGNGSVHGSAGGVTGATTTARSSYQTGRSRYTDAQDEGEDTVLQQ